MSQTTGKEQLRSKLQGDQSNEEEIELEIDLEEPGVKTEDDIVKKFENYHLPVDPQQNDKASTIRLCSFARPHMRAFHFAWWCYHVAFLMWFSISPLLSEIQISLELTKEQIWTSSISAVSGSIFMRFFLGPFCDKYGPRVPMVVILLCGAIPTAMTGLVQNATGLTILRFFIGNIGSAFVMCQYWTTSMFTKEWVGTANATVAGWGNLGGGVTQIFVGSLLFPLFKYIYNGSSEKAWRTVCIVPATLGVITAFCVLKFTDDCPKGNFSKLKKESQMGQVNVMDSYKNGALNINTWLLFVQYACCFGVEITMNNAAALYFKEQFLLSTEEAAAIASIFGWMNLFARGCGGLMSDKSNLRWGMRGRLGCHSFVLLLEGIMVIIFAYSTSLASAIGILIIFSIFVQAAEGTSYGIVPYINPQYTGSISGMVGAGGNVGAVVFGLCFRQLSGKTAFLTMGSIIIFSSMLSIFVFIPGQNSLIWNKNVILEQKAGVVDDEQLTEVDMQRIPSGGLTNSVADTTDSEDGI